MSELTHEIQTIGKQHRSVQRWARSTTEHLIGYCAEVHDSALGECPFDEHVLFVAAWQVWRESRVAGRDHDLCGKRNVRFRSLG